MTSTGSQAAAGTVLQRVTSARATLDTATLDTATLDTATLDTATLDTAARDAAIWDTATHRTPNDRPAPEGAYRHETCQEHITEEEFPRAGQVCTLTPVENPIPGDDLD